MTDVALLLDECQPLRMKAVRNVQGNVRAMSEGRADSPEVIEMLVTDHQSLDFPILQELIDALFSEAAIHPGRIPAGVEQYAMVCAIRCFRFQQGGKASGIVSV